MATHFLAMWSLACNFFGSFGWGSCLPSFVFFSSSSSSVVREEASFCL